VRYLLPKFHAWLMGFPNLSFYIWAVSLTLAILMSTRAIVQNDSGAVVLWEIGVASLLACAFQFWLGRAIGRRYKCPISAGQALGQKNTVFGIWMGYTFLDPVTSVAGGFYSIWHNCYNTYQMYRKRKQEEIRRR
jgi:BASS family bile acid:Na+ symporter